MCIIFPERKKKVGAHFQCTHTHPHESARKKWSHARCRTLTRVAILSTRSKMCGVYNFHDGSALGSMMIGFQQHGRHNGFS